MQVAHVELEAALRALLVFEILGNLHCYNEDTCTPDMRNLFAQLLARQLQNARLSAAGISLSFPLFKYPHPQNTMSIFPR